MQTPVLWKFRHLLWIAAIYGLLYWVAPNLDETMKGEERYVAPLFLFLIAALPMLLCYSGWNIKSTAFAFFWFLLMFVATFFSVKYGYDFYRHHGEKYKLFENEKLLLYFDTCIIVGFLMLYLGLKRRQRHRSEFY